jgi:hypothetical protein
MTWWDLMGKSYESEEAVIEATKKASKNMLELDAYYDLSDDNCNDTCRAWDGNDNRCECRNRRVSWTWDFCKYTSGWQFQVYVD